MTSSPLGVGKQRYGPTSWLFAVPLGVEPKNSKSLRKQPISCPEEGGWGWTSYAMVLFGPTPAFFSFFSHSEWCVLLLRHPCCVSFAHLNVLDVAQARGTGRYKTASDRNHMGYVAQMLLWKTTFCTWHLEKISCVQKKSGPWWTLQALGWR